MSRIIKFVDKILALYEPREGRYLWREVQKKATVSSVEFITTKMPNALFCKNPLEVLEYSLSLKKPGIIAEFGVFSGTTINHMASIATDQTIFGFDSFEGLPEQWFGFLYVNKWFDTKGKMPSVKPNVKLIKGWFETTVPPFFKEQNQPVSILHIDSDIYSSAKTVFDAAKPYLQKGTIIILDEFFNYPGYQLHEFKAFFELIDEIKMDYNFIAYSGNQAAVQLL
jgi:hypothetical protein